MPPIIKSDKQEQSQSENQNLIQRLQNSPERFKPAPEGLEISQEDLQSLAMNGDLGKLPIPARWEYYKWVCKQIGVNPAQRPFMMLTLKGKIELYPVKALAEFIRNRGKYSCEIKKEEFIESTQEYRVYVRVTKPDGRFDEDFGVISLKGFDGQERANKQKIAITQAKNRATWSLEGFGFTDETDWLGVKGAQLTQIEAVIPQIYDLPKESIQTIDETINQIKEIQK